MNTKKIFTALSLFISGSLLFLVFQNCSNPNSFKASEQILESLGDNIKYKKITIVSFFEDAEDIKFQDNVPFNLSLKVINNEGPYLVEWSVNDEVITGFNGQNDIILSLSSENGTIYNISAKVIDSVSGLEHSNSFTVHFSIANLVDPFTLALISRGQQEIISNLSNIDGFFTNYFTYFYQYTNTEFLTSIYLPEGSDSEIKWIYERFEDINPGFSAASIVETHIQNATPPQYINEIVTNTNYYSIPGNDLVPGVYRVKVMVSDKLVGSERVSLDDTFSPFRVSPNKVIGTIVTDLSDAIIVDSTSTIPIDIQIELAHLDDLGNITYSYTFNVLPEEEVVVGVFNLNISDDTVVAVNDTDSNMVTLSFVPSEVFKDGNLNASSVDLEGVFYTEDARSFRTSKEFTITLQAQ